ncbi:hypothetical protein Tco_0256330 [Tanacetum coccineum]
MHSCLSTHTHKKGNNCMVIEACRAINNVSGEVADVVEERYHFLEELDSLVVWLVPAKIAEFLKENQRKVRETVAKLQILGREMELNAREKDMFI